jgi:hypothetical protein
MVKLVMLAVDGDPVFLSPVIRPTASGISASLTAES